jgi:hypothetical protein
MGGGSKKSTTTTEPWGEQKPYLVEGFKEAEQLYETPIQYFPGATTAPVSQEQQQGLSAMATRARTGSPLLSGAQDLTQRTMAGEFVTPESNPYLQHYVQRGMEQILPQMDSAAIKAGAYGGEAWGLQRGRALGDLSAGIYGPAYEAERQRQVQASQYAPGLAREDYQDPARLMSVGEEKRSQEQEFIDEAMRRFEFEQFEPWERLGMYQQLIGGPYGSDVTQRGGK